MLKQAYVTGARHLFGAAHSWASWRAQLSDPAASGRLSLRNRTRRLVITGGKGSVVSEAFKDPRGVYRPHPAHHTCHGHQYLQGGHGCHSEARF